MAIAPNPNVTSTPPPLANVEALSQVVNSLRLSVESLGGLRGGPYDRAVTLSDLVVLGLTTETQLQTILGQTLPKGNR